MGFEGVLLALLLMYILGSAYAYTTRGRILEPEEEEAVPAKPLRQRRGVLALSLIAGGVGAALALKGVLYLLGPGAAVVLPWNGGIEATGIRRIDALTGILYLAIGTMTVWAAWLTASGANGRRRTAELSKRKRAASQKGEANRNDSNGRHSPDPV